MKYTVLISLLSLLLGCQKILQVRVEQNGSAVPRNHREQVIFDYFHALQVGDYEEAYKLRGWDPEASPLDLERFVERHVQYRSSLATTISIGEEEKRDSDDDHCGYTYLVYASNPESSVLESGMVALESNPDAPDECIIIYNSAFGSFP